MIAPRIRRRGSIRSRPSAAPAAAIEVDEEQRRHLIECCAFFRAQRFRDSGPKQYRKQDLRAAAAEIDSVIRPARRRKKP